MCMVLVHIRQGWGPLFAYFKYGLYANILQVGLDAAGR